MIKYSKAYFDKTRQYRYLLIRCWDPDKPKLMVIGLNPSTADEVDDDPTITRCLNYAKKWGYGALYMTNVFAFRATDPEKMLIASDSCGPDNDAWIEKVSRRCKTILCAWGNTAQYQFRGATVAGFLPKKKLVCLKVNNTGHPKHPLYCKKKMKPKKYRPNFDK